MANVSEDRVALTIGRLTLRLIARDQEIEELEGQYSRQSKTLDDLQRVVDYYERTKGEQLALPIES